MSGVLTNQQTFADATSSEIPIEFFGSEGGFLQDWTRCAFQSPTKVGRTPARPLRLGRKDTHRHYQPWHTNAVQLRGSAATPQSPGLPGLVNVGDQDSVSDSRPSEVLRRHRDQLQIRLVAHATGGDDITVPPAWCFRIGRVRSVPRVAGVRMLWTETLTPAEGRGCSMLKRRYTATNSTGNHQNGCVVLLPQWPSGFFVAGATVSGLGSELAPT